jgi:hypothetical protein
MLPYELPGTLLQPVITALVYDYLYFTVCGMCHERSAQHGSVVTTMHTAIAPYRTIYGAQCMRVQIKLIMRIQEMRALL